MISDYKYISLNEERYMILCVTIDVERVMDNQRLLQCYISILEWVIVVFS